MEYSVSITKVEDKKIKARVEVTLENRFVVKNMAITETKDGNLFLVMPGYYTGKTTAEGYQEYKNYVRPASKEFREELQKNVLDTYNSMRGTMEVINFGEKTDNLSYEIRVTPYEKEGSNIRGLGTVIFENSLAVENISVLATKSDGHLFVSMPSYSFTNKEGVKEYRDIAYPISKEFRDQFDNDILNEYQVRHDMKMEAAMEKAEQEASKDKKVDKPKKSKASK